MVITDKSEEALQDAGPPQLESPPPYTYSGPATSEPSHAVLRRVAPPIAHCNNVVIKRASGTKVEGAFVVDPALEIPAEVLGPVDDGEERKNLLISVPNLAVDADVWIVGSSSSSSSPPADVKTRARSTTVEVLGNDVNLRLHATGDRPIALTVKADGAGNISLALPRDFRGPVTIHTGTGRVIFSPALGALSVTFSEHGEVIKCFVGDFKSLGFGQGAWEGSAVQVHAPAGRVKLRFTDEPEPKTPMRPWWDWSVLVLYEGCGMYC